MNFDFYNDTTSLVAFGILVNEPELDIYNIDELLNESTFNYKTNIEKSS